MKRVVHFAFFLTLLLFGCGKSEPGKINLDLKFDSSVTSGIKSSIKSFVFVIGESGSSTRLIYPSSCLGCSSSTSPCPAADQCFQSSTCGFLATASKFDPQIDFSDIAKGKTMEVTSCALNSSAVPVSMGIGNLKNQAGATAEITMKTDVTDCINNLPSVVCP